MLDLAAEFGISRAHIREILSQLEQRGLVVRVPNRGAMVAYLAPEQLMPGGSRRNLACCRIPDTRGVGEEDLLLLSDAQTSGGLLVAGDSPARR